MLVALSVDLTNDMASGYNPTDVERSWYAWWRDCQFFVPAIPSATPSEYSHYDPTPSVLPRNDQGELDWSRVSKDKTFVIPAPPPNVTGKLHIGHALAFGLQDTLIRWWVPFTHPWEFSAADPKYTGTE